MFWESKLQPKPDPEKFKAKRKAEGPPTEADTNTEPLIPSISSKKLAKKEFICTMCKITTTSEITLNTHLKGKKHKAKEGRGLETGEVHKQPSPPEQAPPLENKGSFKFWCETCLVGTRSLVVMETHNKGKKHRARLLKLGQCKLDEQKEPNGLMSCASPEGRGDDSNSITL